VVTFIYILKLETLETISLNIMERFFVVFFLIGYLTVMTNSADAETHKGEYGDKVHVISR